MSEPIHDDPWRELCGRVWDQWVGDTWRHRLVRSTMPRLAAVLDAIAERESEYLAERMAALRGYWTRSKDAW